MGKINLVEYKPSYAKGLAEMWRKSADGWNGFGIDTTEEEMLRKHEGTTNINTYLAVNGDEVLGYCAFSEYLEDEGALYIKLLNTRSDYHGKGIGKTLVLKSIERTIELGVPRLDLYTWASNKKSIPLYKKCGFFLEKRSDTTHLMNFIPSVLNTEAVKDYFNHVDWYKNMKRELDLEPDGKEENDFNFYEYHWEKDGHILKMEFDKKSRGLRLIETDDYIIKIYCEDSKLIFGKKYKVFYEAVNKSGKPLEISINGVDDKNIKFSFDKTVEVKERELIEGEFYVGEIEEEIDDFKTHPSVSSKLLINGKRAEFKLGIVPKFPLKISLLTKEDNYHKDEKTNLYINLENNFDDEAIFKFTLNENNDIKFDKTEFNVEMKGKEKNSIEVPLTLINPAIYSTEVAITVELSDKKKLQFRRKLSAVFKGSEGRFGGETENEYIISNGLYSVELDKKENVLNVKVIGEDEVKNSFNFPKIGKPYSSEFSNKKLASVKWFSENDYIVMKVEYISEEFKDIKVCSITKLHSNGIVEHNHEIINMSDKESSNEVCFNGGVHHDLGNGFIPYNNRIIQNLDSNIDYIGCYDIDKITENWMFTKDENSSVGISWNRDLKPMLDDWYIYFEHNFGKIPGNESRATKPVYLALNAFSNWQEFRRYALKNGSSSSMELAADNILVDDLEVSINNNNPFVRDKFTVKVKEHRQTVLDGKLTLNSDDEIFEAQTKKFKNDDNISETEYEVCINGNSGISTINLEANFKSMAFEKKKLVFKKDNVECESEIIEECDHKVYSLNNGVMEIKAAPTFGHNLYSIIYKNQEWLDSPFPQLKPRTWFNPWYGGIGTIPGEYSFSASILQEQHVSAEFVTMEDNFKNLWSGIKVELPLVTEDKFNGLQINQYYLMLPGVPVVCHTAEVISKDNQFIDAADFMTMNYFKMSEEIKEGWIRVNNRKGQSVKYKAGIEAFDISSKSSILYGSNERENKIQLYTDFEKVNPWVFINLEDNACFNTTKLSGYHDEKIFTPPAFYIFAEDKIEDDLLKDLKNIKF